MILSVNKLWEHFTKKNCKKQKKQNKKKTRNEFRIEKII